MNQFKCLFYSPVGTTRVFWGLAFPILRLFFRGKCQTQEELKEFRDFVKTINPDGGEDEPESGLEALYLAIRSDWNKDAGAQKRRHIIVLLTDASAHKLDDPMRETAENYPTDMEIPTSLSGLQEEWLNGQHMDKNGRRLILFAPNDYPWNEVGVWKNANSNPSSAGKGLDEVDMELVYSYIVNSI